MLCSGLLICSFSFNRNFEAENMNAKTVKATFILIGIALITGVILHRINERSKSFQAEEKSFLRFQKNTEPIIPTTIAAAAP